MSNITCAVCESVVSLIGAEAHLANATIEAVSVAVMKLCFILGGKIVARECDFLVENIDNIVRWISNGVSNKNICKKLELCSNDLQ